MLQTIRNAWKLPELRSKLLFTLFILFVYRIGSTIPVPFVNPGIGEAIGAIPIFQYLQVISGSGFSQATLFALSISPYITSQIVIQLLTVAIPALERMAKEGDEGRKKIARISRYTTIALSLVTAFGYYTVLKSYGMVADNSAFTACVIVASYCAGASLIMWLAEKINDNGIGNGISLILLVNILSSIPGVIMQIVSNAIVNPGLATIVTAVVVVVLTILIICFVVHMNNAERRVPVQYAKRQVGRRMYGGQSTYLPLKLNMSGVMPIIFASSIVSLPATIGAFAGVDGTGNGFWDKFINWFSYQSPVYAVIYFVLIIAFSYFYISISFNPIEVSNNLKKNGGTIYGIRPGKPTTDFITKILSKITLIGAIFLGVIAVLPLLVTLFTSNTAMLAFGGSSIIIVVGVIIETVTEIETQMTMRHYKGFLE